MSDQLILNKGQLTKSLFNKWYKDNWIIHMQNNESGHLISYTKYFITSYIKRYIIHCVFTCKIFSSIVGLSFYFLDAIHWSDFLLVPCTLGGIAKKPLPKTRSWSFTSVFLLFYSFKAVTLGLWSILELFFIYTTFFQIYVTMI